MVPLLEALLLLFPRKFHDAPESAFLERGTVLVGFPAALYADYLAHAGSRLGEGDRHMPRCVLAAPSSRTRRFPVRRGRRHAHRTGCSRPSRRARFSPCRTRACRPLPLPLRQRWLMPRAPMSTRTPPSLQRRQSKAGWPPNALERTGFDGLLLGPSWRPGLDSSLDLHDASRCAVLGREQFRQFPAADDEDTTWDMRHRWRAAGCGLRGCRERRSRSRRRICRCTAIQTCTE